MTVAEELADALDQLQKLRAAGDAMQAELEQAESERDDLRTELAYARSEAADAGSKKEDAEAEAEALQGELDEIHTCVGLRSIIERALSADPIATENDLLTAGLGDAICVLRIDHQQGRLNFTGAQ